MKKTTHCRTEAIGMGAGARAVSMGLVATLLLPMLTTSMPAVAAPCKDVEIHVDNKTGGTIRLTKFRYRDRNSGNANAWRTENIPNQHCDNNRSCDTQSDTLGSLTNPRRNHILHSFQVQHQHRDGNGWGPRQWSQTFLPEDEAVANDETCQNHKEYGPWTLDN